MTTTISLPSGPFTATSGPPGDKSMSHRALLFSAMASGTSQVLGAGPGADVAATATAIRRLGVVVDRDGTIHSPGVAGWHPPDSGPEGTEAIDCGNSGTTLRLLAGALAGRPFATALTGDESLRRRPMRRLVEPLTALGGSVQVTLPDGTAPVTVNAPSQLQGAAVTIPIASAQVRSAFALAALQAEGESLIDSPGGYRDHTERWLESWGLGERLTATAFRIWPGEVPTHRYLVPADPSSAAYLWALAAVRPGSQVTTPGVSLNPGRIGFLQILERFGAKIEAEVTGTLLGDPIGTVTVRHAGLFGTTVDGELAVAALDELPLVAVVGALAEGITTVADATELRAKESDRIASTVAMIHALGGGAEPTGDGFAVVGTGFLEPGTVRSENDHRIAMAAGVAAAGVVGDVTIDDGDVVDVSWPGYFDQIRSLWTP